MGLCGLGFLAFYGRSIQLALDTHSLRRISLIIVLQLVSRSRQEVFNKSGLVEVTLVCHAP